MKTLILLLVLACSTAAHAKEASYIRDYTYKASDLDSKVSARNNTLKLIKAGVLEEIVSYVYNSTSLEQSQAGSDFRSTFIQQTSASSAGFVKARILDENWNGFEMTIKAEVRADPDQIRQELERALSLGPGSPGGATHPRQAQPRAATHPASVPATAQSNMAPQQTAGMPPLMPVSNTTADYSGYLRVSQLAQVQSLLQPLRMTMTEYYMMNGEWPSSLKQINLKPEDMTDGQYLEKVRLGKKGQILAYLSDTFGKNRILSLAPRSIMGGMQTRWDCSTNINTRGLVGFNNLNCSEDKNLR